MRNPKPRKSRKHHRQPSPIRTIQLRQRRQNQRDGRILHQIRMHARRNEKRIVGIAVRLFDAGAFFAIFRDGLVALPGVEVDALFDYVEREEGMQGYEGDGEAAGDGEDFTEP